MTRITRILGVLACAALFLASIQEARAQNEWVRLVPFDSAFKPMELVPLSGVAIPGEQTIIINPYRNYLWRSDDGGRTFHQVAYPFISPSPLLGIAFSDAMHGMGVGLAGTAVRTTDGGITWIFCAQTQMTGRALAYATRSRVIAVGDSGQRLPKTGCIMRTNGTGGTWTAVQAPAGGVLRSVSFPDSLVGYCCGDGGRILKSTDGGSVWTALDSKRALTFTSIRFADPLHGFVAANSLVLATKDGGATWDSVASSGTAVTCYDAATVLLATYHSISRSTDSARSWTVASTEVGANGSIESIAFGPGGLCAAVGPSGGIVLISNDSGRNWRQVAGSLDTDKPLGLHFPTADRGYLCAANARVFRSSDSGASWQRLVPPVATDYNDVHFTTRNMGWLVGGRGTALRTEDAGRTWYPTNTGVGAALRSVYFFDAMHGLIVGDSGIILKTSNGGISWNKRWSGTQADLTAVRWTSSVSAVATCSDGGILRTEDGGVFWLRTSTGTTSALHSLSFTDASTGWASGLNGAIFRTTDGGESWTSLTPPETNTLPETDVPGWTIRFADGLWGLAGGDPMVKLWSTSDGGDSWREAVSNRTMTLRSACFPHPSLGYCGADQAQVYRGLREQTQGPRLSISSRRIGFGRRFVDTTVIRTFTLANIGSAPFQIASITIEGRDSLDFSVLPFDASPLQVRDGTHSISIACRPTAAGAKEAMLRIRSNDTSIGTASIPLTATCVRASWLCSADRLRFGDVCAGGMAERKLTLICMDTGFVPPPRLFVAGEDSARFTSSGPASGLYQAGDRIDETIRFSPDRLGTAEALLRFADGGGIAPRSIVTMEGTGVPSRLKLSLKDVDFGAVPVGRSKDIEVRIGNIGTGDARFSLLTIDTSASAVFQVTAFPAMRIAEGDSTRMTIRFTPRATGSTGTSLRLVSGDSTLSDIMIPLSGFGIGPLLSTGRDTIDFGYVVYDRTVRDTVIVSNTGYLPLHVVGQAITGPDSADLRIVQAADAILAPAAVSLVVLEYTPRVRAYEGAMLRLESDATWAATRTLPIRAFIVRWSAFADTDSLFCDTVQVHASKQKRISLRNGSTTPTWLSGLSITGSGASAFTAFPDDYWMETADALSIHVRFRPLAVGPASALLVLHLQDSARTYNVTVKLAGVGSGGPTGIDAVFPEAVSLGPIHPQPASAVITVPVSLLERAAIRLIISNALGRRVAVLADGLFEQGEHSFTVDTRSLPPGLYLAQLDAGGAVHLTKRLLVVR
jgi:photosystem II stability/assembly factor-like uncharacterized protein